MKQLIRFFTVFFIILNLFSTISAATINLDGTKLVSEDVNLKLDGFELIDQNSNFNLYLDRATANIIVFDVKNNDFWATTPLDIDLNTSINPYNKNRIKSQLIIGVLNLKDIETIASSFVEVTNKGTIAYEIEDGKLRIVYEFTKFSIVIPVEYELTEDGLKSRIVLDDITEDGDFRLIKIALNPFLGAAKRGEEGFILIPDGSGAIMEFDSAKTADVYNFKIYGNDYALNDSIAHLQNKTIPFPMYAVSSEENTTLGIVIDGEGFGNIVAQQSNAATGYNYAYFEFDVRLTDEYYLNAQNAAITRIVAYSAENMYANSALEVEYQFLSEPSTYVDIAGVYQAYLIENGDLTEKENMDSSVLNLNMYGGLILDEVFLGIPYLAYQSLTTFPQSLDIMTAFVNEGVTDFNVNYRFWQKDGVVSAGVPDKIRVNSTLEKGLNQEDFIAEASELGIDIFWNYDFITYLPNAWSLTDSKNAVRTISKSYAYIYEYSRDTKLRWSFNSPVLLSSLYLNDVIESNREELPENISLSNIVNMVYSDIEENALSTENTIEYFEDALQVLSVGRTVLSEKPNQYAFEATDIAIDVPLYSSQFINFTYDIPFYQLVVRGCIDYFAEDSNLSASPMKHFLKAVETGSGLSFSLTDANATILHWTKYEDMMNMDYRDWFDFIVARYNDIEEVRNITGNSSIINHTYVESDLIVIEYSNGVKVIVNYDKTDKIYNDIVIPAVDFIIVH